MDGRDKSRLLVQGHPIINRQLDVLQPLTPHIFIVAPDPDRFADLGVPVVPDRIPGLGAIGGIYTAVDAAPADRVITVACDLPFLETAWLEQLVELSTGRDGAWIRTARGPEPLVACYRRRARAAIKAQIDAGDLTAAHLGRVLNLAELDAPDRLLVNINTPEDYDRYNVPE